MVWQGDSSEVADILGPSASQLSHCIDTISKALSAAIQSNTESMSIISKLLTMLAQGQGESGIINLSNPPVVTPSLDLEKVSQILSDASERASQTTKSDEKVISDVRGSYKDVSLVSVVNQGFSHIDRCDRSKLQPTCLYFILCTSHGRQTSQS